MRILLVNPAIRPDSPKCILNVGLGYVGTALKNAGHEIAVLDMDAHRYDAQTVERLIREASFDAAGVGTLVSQYRWAQWVASVIRDHHPHVPIVAGNTLATSIPDHLLTNTEFDVAVLGEGEETAVDLFDVLEEGGHPGEVPGLAWANGVKVEHTDSRPVIKDIDTIPIPDYEGLFDIEIYLERSKWMVPAPETLPVPFEEIVAMPVSTARGCPFSCSFCFHAFQNLKYRHRTPESVVSEMEHWRDTYGVNYVHFWDELSLYQAKATERLADLIIERAPGISFFASCRSELLNHDNAHIAGKLKTAGCKGLGFSLESGSEEILLAMNKHNHVSDFVTQCEVLHDAGIEVYTSLVFGYPQETPETIAETFSVCELARVYPSVGYLQPMPGTPMFDLALETGAIRDVEAYLHLMGDRQDLRVNLTQLDQAEMEQVVHQHLVALNESLQTGLAADELIKTRAYRIAKEDSFLEGFGQAAKVQVEAC